MQRSVEEYIDENDCEVNATGSEARHIIRLEMITSSIPLDRLSEICAAENDGRCVVLPCKVGDTVYFTDEEYPTATIEEIKLSSGEIEYCWVQYDTGPETCELWDEGYFTDDDLGKTVFLTRAEAEAEKGGDQ